MSLTTTLQTVIHDVSKFETLLPVIITGVEQNVKCFKAGNLTSFCDYKIATKSIASRMRKVLPRIINNDQTGFLKNRFIGENIRLLDSIINYTNTE